MPAASSPARSLAADHHKVLIVGAGAAGIATASSLRARDPSLDIALIDPADVHYYQSGWTMVGAGVFQPQSTARTMASTLPAGVRWIKAAVASFEPQAQSVSSIVPAKTAQIAFFIVMTIPFRCAPRHKRARNEVPLTQQQKIC